eukprot:g23459.t1
MGRRSGRVWGNSGEGTGDRDGVSLQRKLPIRADAAGLLQLGPRVSEAAVRRKVQPLLKAWKWNPELATHVLKTLAKPGRTL